MWVRVDSQWPATSILDPPGIKMVCIAWISQKAYRTGNYQRPTVSRFLIIISAKKLNSLVADLTATESKSLLYL